MLKRIISYCVLFLFAITAIAQKSTSTESCGQKEITEKLFIDNPTLKQFNDQIERSLIQNKRKIQSGELKEARTAAVVTLPVVVHIIHNNGSENITDAQVFQGIQHLNEAFANTGFYDPADGVNTEIQFCLAQRDPNNNPTNGITRDVSPYTVMGGPTYYSDDQQVKNINRWNPKCYINIWLVKSIPGSVAGYAYLPSAHGTNVDGIVQEAAYFGSSFTNDVVSIHEMGHYLGLYHTFEGACTNNDCAADGDKVCDTPPDQSTASVSCATTMNSCTTDALSGFSTDQNDLKEDYMDYGNFNCMKVFTAGQSLRMNWFIQNVRNSLLACKSCLTPCPTPVTADFTVPASPLYPGNNYTFTNSSVNASTYEWYVNGVLQGTSSNFNFTFLSIGSFTIKLIAKSGNALCNDAEKVFTINTICPVAAGFTKSASISAAGSPINFTNTSTGATNYEWFVNGVSLSTATNYSYTSTTAGQYIIRLLAKNNIANCEKEYVDTVNFTCPVMADFSPATSTTIINTAITFTSSGSGASSYEWFINGVSSGTGPLFNYIFSSEGSFEIKLVASNGTCSSAKIGFVYVTDKCGNANYLYQKGYPQGQNSWGIDIRSTADGGSIVAERVVESGSGGFDASLLKLDAAGNVQWDYRYDNKGVSNFKKVKATNDGGYIAIGSIGNPTPRVFIIKTSGSGNTLWSRDYTLGNYANGNDIIQAADGAFYFVGTASFSGVAIATDDVVIGKLDASGNLVWIKNYDARGFEQGYGIAEDNNQLIICGNKAGSQSASGFILKVNKVDGSTVWSKSYSSVDENFTEVSVHASGYYVNGTRRSSVGSSYSDHLFLTTDFSGNTVYSRFLRPFGTGNNIGGASSYINNAGNIVSQTTKQFGGSFFDFIVMETNPVTGITWAKKYNRQAWMSAITNSGSNGILLTGGSFGSVGQPVQTFVMRLDSAGNAGGCPSENVNPELLQLNFTEASVDWIGKSIQNYSPPGAYREIAVTTIPNTICSTTKCDSVPPAPCGNGNVCDSIKIIGADSICNFKDSVTYTTKRSEFCNTIPVWKLSDSTFGEIVMVNDSTVKIKFTKNGTVLVQAILSDSCKVLSDSIIVNIIQANDKIDLGPDIMLCKISTINLNATAGFKSYKWNDGSTDSTLTVYNPGQYFIEATNICGNIYRDTINIIQAPDVPFDLGPDLSKCDNDTISITAPTGFMKYSWSANYNINNTSLPAVKIWPDKDTSYTVVAQLSTGCIVIDTVQVKVFKTVPFTIGNDTSFCAGGNILLKAPPGYSAYLWQDGSSSQTLFANTKGTYQVTLTDNNGCSIKDTVLVDVLPTPTVDLGNVSEICKSPDAILDAGNGFSAYLWQDGSTTSKISITQTGKYWVQVTGANNCRASDTLQITGFKTAPHNFIDPTAELCSGQSVNIKAKGSWSRYLWFNNSSSPSTTISTGGKYWLEVTNSDGCTSKESITIITKDCMKGIYFPNAFTPNSDGKNDTYKPVSKGVLIRYHLTIYNRFGEKVFESTEPLKGWDGKYANKKQDTYTFAWVCAYQFQGEPEKMEKGTVTLIR